MEFCVQAWLPYFKRNKNILEIKSPEKGNKVGDIIEKSSV